MTRTEINALFEKICNTRSAIAVFVRNGHVRSTKISTGLFIEAMKKTPEQLMGIYTADCLPEWLEDDLAYMGAA